MLNARKLYIIGVLVLFFQGVLLAQPSYNFYRIFLDKGLSDTRVNSIVQDKYGFMWFGTANGLNRFDGYSITRYFSDTNTGLPSNSILSMHSTRKGELWIGTSTGLVRFDFAKKRFIPFDSTQKEAAVINRMAVFDFEEDNQGNMYVGGSEGLFRYWSENNKWENLTNYYKVEKRMLNIRKLKFLNEDMLYATTNGSLPFFEINIKTNKIDSLPSSIDTCCLNMFGLESLNENELLTGYLSFGMTRLNVKTRKFTTVPGLGKNDSIRYNTVYDILRDHAGRVWVASFYYRLAQYFPQENRIIAIEADSYNPYGYDGGSVISLYEDKQHNIWVGTGSKGVYRFNPSNNAVKFHSQNDFIRGSLQRGSVLSLCVLDSSQLLIGTEKGPSFYNYTTGEYTNYKGSSTTGTNQPVENIQCGLVDKKGIVWMGSNRLGLLRFDPRIKTFRGYSRVSKPYPLIDDGMTDLLLLPDERIFLIGYGRPAIFDPVSAFYTSYRTDSADVFKLTGINTIAYDAKQHIWLANPLGKLYEYDPLKNSLTDRSNLLEQITPLNIYKIAWQGEQLFLGTNKGIVLIKSKGPLILFSLNLPQMGFSEVRGLLPDGEHIWFSNNRVIGRLQMSTGKMQVLGEKEGLANVQLFSRSLARSPEGHILIGSSRGYYEIFPERLKEMNTSAAVYLTDFRIYDQSLQTDEVISDIKNIKLRHNQNFFAFDISAFNYTEAEDMEYAYMLDGFDKDWQYIGNKRSGSYTNVPGGQYVLRLKARNASGEWNESGQSVRIHIGKPISATWWFRLLLLSAVVGIFYLLYHFRIRQINKDARVRSDYEIKLNELENSALRTQMNPHFIFNSLNTINSFINSNDRAQANQYISKFSKLVRLILDHSREKKIALTDELEVTELYIQLEQIRFEDKFQYNIDIKDLDPSITELPPLIIQPFVENAILHGLLPKGGNGKLQIDIRKKGNLLQCSIEDNGIGREAAKKIKEKSGYQRKSHGIEITLKRIELFNKEQGVQESVGITT